MDLQRIIDSIFQDQFKNELNTHYLKNRIVRKPDQLLKALQSITENSQESQYDYLAQLLSQCSPIQAIVLIHNQNEIAFDRILNLCLTNPQNKVQLFRIIDWFLQTITLTKKNYKSLFMHIKTEMYNGTLNPNKVQIFIELLQKVYEKYNYNSPYASFYFNYIHSGLVVDTREMKWLFSKGITFQTWLYPISINSQSEMKLMYLMSDKKKGCQLVLDKNKLVYQYVDLNSPHHEARISLIEIVQEEWQQLCVQIQLKKYFLQESYYLSVNCGNHSLREIKIDFPNLSNDSLVIEFQFFNHFYGFATSLLIYNEGFDGNELNCGDKRFGIQSNEHLRTLNFGNSKLILCYTPLRARANFITDPISQFDGALQSYSGSYVRYTQKQHFSQFCRIENFVPLLLFLKLSPYDSLLNELLALFCTVINSRPEFQLDALRVELLSLIALKINEDGLQLINGKTIEMLSSLHKHITHIQLKEQFVGNLLWRIQIFKLKDFEIIQDYLKFLRMIYNENPEFYISIFGISKILEILIYDIDPQNRLCCEEHANQMGYSNFQLPTIPYAQLMESYLSIFNNQLDVIDAILHNKVQAKKIEEQNIIDIARVFTMKCSPCFYQLLLKKLQGLFQFETKSNNPISQILIQEEVMQMLLNLLTTCSCPDVKTSCIKLIAESIRINQSPNEKEIANWIAHTLGNSAAVEVLSDEEDYDEILPRKPLINQALVFHQQEEEESSFEEKQKPANQKKKIIQPSKRIIDYEPLYVAIMEWMLRTRVGKTNSDTFILDENYVIKSDGGLSLLISYFQYCVDSVKGRIMQDLCMLVKWNQQSALFLLGNEEFHWWILENLLDIQYEYNTRELSQFEFWVWDSGLKLYCNVIKTAMLHEKNGYLRIAQLQNYCKVLEKPNRQVTTQLLIRLILKQLLQSFTDCYKQDLFSKFWINLYSVVFESLRLTVADPRTTSSEHDFLFNKFTAISSRLSISEQEMPRKWKQQFGTIQWMDHIYVVNVCEIVNQYCAKFSTQILAYIDDYQIVQKGIFGLLESCESQKTFGSLMFQFNFGQQNTQPPCFVQVCQMFLQLSSEYFAFNLQSSENMKQLQMILNTLDKLTRTLIISSETLKDKEMEDWQEKCVYQIIGSHFNFLYKMQTNIGLVNYDTEIKKDLLNLVNTCLFQSFKFLVVYVDCFVYLLNKNESYQILIYEGYKQWKMFVIRMLKDLIKRDGSYLFDVQEAKSLKLNNKLIQERMQSAKQVFLENESLVQKIDQLFFLNEEFYILMKCDFEDSNRLFEQKLKNLQDKLQKQRQNVEEVLFAQMYIIQLFRVNQSTAYSYDQKIQRIDTEQICMRQARYMFKKAFNRVRLFDQWWAHPDFKAQIDKSFDSFDLHYDNIVQNQIFTWKMWKYETKQKSRPLLKLKMQEFPELDNKFEQQSNSRIMNLVDYHKKQPEKQRRRIHEKIIDTLNPFYIEQQNELILHHVQWIKTLTVRVGTLRISDTHLIFYFESITQKETHQSLIKFRVPQDSQLVKQWDLEQLYDIQFRRYIGRWTSLELILQEGSTLVFNFQPGDHYKIIDKLIHLKKSKQVNLKPRILIGKFDPPSVILESKSLTKWYNYKITTFEYLMKLNKISGRSHKDLTQYPVFPWIMNDGEQLHKYRDLNKSMGALGGKERIEVFEQRYNMIDHFNKMPQFHYGSHYSSPAIIFHYLIRLKPFSDGAKELQSGKFDLADRLFFSFVETYRNATEELSDVRELIPEFYYLPEMFLNLSKYDYGLQQTGQRVNNVELPLWTQQNPYTFICAHRMELESDYVSMNINNWIDLIFGYKQKGEEAVKALNTFYYLTYENALDWDGIKNEKQKISLESQAIHFGQCPSQIWERPHPQRGRPKVCYRIVDEKMEKKILRQKPNEGISKNQAINYNRQKSIIRIQFISENRVWLIRRNGECSVIKLELKDNKFDLNWQKEQTINLDKFTEENTHIFDWTCNYDELPILNKGKQILIGGIWDGRMLIYNNGLLVEQKFEQESTITVLRFDYKMRILATGSKDGTLVVYKTNSNGQFIQICKHHHHDQPITDIFVCNDLKVVVTCSNDGWIHMYNQWSGKYLRSYCHPKKLSISKVCTFCTPLYGIAFYENKNIYSYSINGQFLAHYELKQYIVNQGHLKVVKDSKLNDIIIVPLCMEKKILMLSTPFLGKRNEIQLTDNIQSMNDISAYAVSQDRTIMAIGTSDGEFGLVVDQRIFQQE